MTPRSRTGDRAIPRRIGVLLQWGVGDAVLTLPLLHALHDAWPDAAIVPIGKPFMDTLLRGEPGLVAGWPLVPPWTRFSGKYRLWEPVWRSFIGDIARVRRDRLDLLVLPRCDPRDAVQARILRAARVAGFATAGGGGWLTDPVDFDRLAAVTMPRGQAAAALATVITKRQVDPVPRFRHWPDGQEVRAQLAAAGYRGGPILAVSFDASHPIRQWAPERIDGLLARCRERLGGVVLIEEPGRPMAISAPSGVPAVTWRSDLYQLRGLLGQMDAVVCTDSGVMHMAAASGRPVVAIFGPGDPATFAPAGPGHVVIAADRMACRPCYDSCVWDRPRCYDAVTDDAVVAAIENVLARG